MCSLENENPLSAVLSTSYLGPISYYCKLYAHPQIIIEQHEHYIKQTYRNRCLIAAPNGAQSLTVPIIRDDASHTEICDIQISNHGNWRHLHWQALVTAYESSPFFEYYVDDFRPFYERSYKYLMDFNESLREKVCELLDLQPQVNLSLSYQAPTDVVADYRQLISPKATIEDAHFSPKNYYQVFQQRNGFQSNLSIVDLLFNMGPESLLVLRDSIK